MADKNKVKADGAKAVKPHKIANIIVGVVVGIALLLIIAIVVMCSVSVDPLDGLKRPAHYYLYDTGSSSTSPISDSPSAQSKIYTALGKMDHSVMTGVLQGRWDYSYNLLRDTSGKVIQLTAKEVSDIGATSTAYMVEYEYENCVGEYGKVDYKKAQVLEVDGKKIYFDRVKVVIPDSGSDLIEIKLYPYIYNRVVNQTANDGLTYEEYRVVPITVVARTAETFADLKDIAEKASR